MSLEDLSKPKKLLQIERVAMAAQLLREGFKVRLEVRGFSMQPLIPDGAIVELVPLEIQKLRRGDIVLSIDTNLASLSETLVETFLVHRVMCVYKEEGEWWVRTRADTGFEYDKALKLTSYSLPGIVVGVESGGYRSLYTAYRWRILNALLGWAANNQLICMRETESAKGNKLGQWGLLRWVMQRKFFSALFFLLRKVRY